MMGVFTLIYQRDDDVCAGNEGIIGFVQFPVQS